MLYLVKYSFYPRTTGNGNCLFNACSIALIGNEPQASCLRCLTSIELCQNLEFYAFHPLIKEQNDKGAFHNLNNAFAMTISDAALEAFAEKQHNKAVLSEALNIAKDFTYSSFLCVLALASVIRQPIEAYYPVNSISHRKCTEIMFNATIIPRIPNSVATKIHMLRCAVAPLDFVTTAKIPEKKNHYVPLLPIPSTSDKFSKDYKKTERKGKRSLQMPQFVPVMPKPDVK